MPKVVLTLIILGVLVYFVVRRLQGGAKPRPARSNPPRVIAPDDDEQFLRDIEFRRHQERRRRGQEGEGDVPPSTSEPTDPDTPKP